MVHTGRISCHTPVHVVTVGTTILMMLAVMFATVTSVSAGQLPDPQGPVILTMSGRLANHNGHGAARFDRKMIVSLGLRDLTTHTIYSKVASNWRGILVRDLLHYVGAKGKEVEVYALDDYRSTIPISDFEKYDVLLAVDKDGEALTIRTRGPTRIIYPYDQNEELHDTKFAARYVWQIKKMIVK